MGIKMKDSVKPQASVYDVHLNPAESHTEIKKIVTHKGGEKQEQLLSQDDTVVNEAVQTTGHPCHVRVGGGQTISTAPYESVRIEISLSVPCEKEQIEETFEFASDWVSQKMMEATKSVKG